MTRSIPKEWKAVAIKTIADVKMGQSPNGETYNTNGDGVLFLQGNADFSNKYPVAKYWTSNPIKLADPGDILISVRAPVGELNVADRKYCIGRGLAALKPSRVIQAYLFHVLSNKKNELQRFSTGSTFEAINKKTIEDLPILFPPLPEQEKIAEILGSVDEAIAATRRVIEQTRTLKRALMQDLFGHDI